MLTDLVPDCIKQRAANAAANILTEARRWGHAEYRGVTFVFDPPDGRGNRLLGFPTGCCDPRLLGVEGMTETVAEVCRPLFEVEGLSEKVSEVCRRLIEQDDDA